MTCTLSNNSDYTAPGVRGANDAALKATATCAWTAAGGHPIWFNADYSLNWRAHVNPTDEHNSPINLSDSSTISTNAVQALNVPLSTYTIAYGTVALGEISAGQAITVENVGNQILDILIEGTNMTRQGGGGIIPFDKQRWSGATQDFTFANGNPLVSSSLGATTALEGCWSRDIAIRPAHDSGNSSDVQLFWKLQMPNPQTAGSYSGQNSLLASPSDTCSY